ncbi:hypothetical protein [Rhizorhabdus dicambivorans]|uniref:Uncharacterized protein n=1 Tax=Rhizorhabdus dicambivorans TaxID=1850238 RepID=A0A2A4FXZ2_9SPHN|nr:hypothetical protein [Rhizorhabdus dicambivorans]ATE63435.1 hypothetical protein CMV14_02655 [Rhizorhabdus dicambivorans]PCE43654.1 hypothetical protein COO09_04975 [Rhizorhabdus dicambivorans]
MRSKIVVILAAALTFPGAAFAVESGPADAKGDPGDKVVCKTRPQTGTRFRTKVCHTVAQWDIIAEEMRRTAQEMNGRIIEVRRE